MPTPRARDTLRESLETTTDAPQSPRLAIISPTPRAFTFPSTHDHGDSPYSSPSYSPFEPHQLDLRQLPSQVHQLLSRQDPTADAHHPNSSLPEHSTSSPHTPEVNKRVRMLVSELQRDKSAKKVLVYTLRGVDAQCMVDVLNKLLLDGELDNSERRHTLRLLCKIAKQAQVYPRSCELTGVYCPLAHAGELALWAHISHRNILPLYGVYLSDEAVERICIVSPWMKYGDLLQYLKTLPKSPRTPLILDIIRGLRYLHSVDIIHGDLKASNVLISREGHAMLADFGVSHIIMTMGTTTTRGFTSTANWTAPELLLEEDETEPMATKESDVWSFACTCYEALTGQMPFFHIKKVVHLIRALMRGIRPLRATFPEECDTVKERLWALMERCWNYNPEERPDAEEIEQMVSELMQTDDRSSFDASLVPTPSEIMKPRNEIAIDYDRALMILRRIEEASIDHERVREDLSVASDVMHS
ncbi:hypothetical protein NP233_g1899 [Leucocoprinus birnbaumii]|uniref:Protein kinase domain-containing protein n=1 Tax=Leucocoprinus birnbaumii TaxID=56174 RepID=A0AAD5YZE0_9AGAR|nr:hypothetical protein NP233_g1899 [Leucocoprinus birnbaumii]